MRERPNAAQRHEPLIGAQIQSDRQDYSFTYETNLEWLSLNWRKYRASQISASFRRLILYMFERDFEYFPTLREIRDGLIGGQMQELEKQKEAWCENRRYRALQIAYIIKWKLLFNFAHLGDLEKPLNRSILADPDHAITK